MAESLLDVLARAPHATSSAPLGGLAAKPAGGDGIE
jgi:hypothetical protein